ncbi:MAG: hypothetical protein K2P80_10215 [Beijerinckiaceae bacterium]|nr:hypothetical protein [Beijerinckiaceae bacterium]
MQGFLDRISGVADEVRSLARRSSSSTGEIASLVTDTRQRITQLSQVL